MEEKKEPYGSDEKIVEIELERLRSFENHPFKVTEDGQMMELQESIKKYTFRYRIVDFKFIPAGMFATPFNCKKKI